MKRRHFAAQVGHAEQPKTPHRDGSGDIVGPPTNSGTHNSRPGNVVKSPAGNPPIDSDRTVGNYENTTESQTEEFDLKDEINSFESNSDHELESESDSESESEDLPVKPLQRPKFIPKSKRIVKTQATEGSCSNIDWNAGVTSTKPVAHQVDDTDGIDCQSEYNAWKERRKTREERDLATIAQCELEYEERMERLENAAKRARDRDLGKPR